MLVEEVPSAHLVRGMVKVRGRVRATSWDSSMLPTTVSSLLSTPTTVKHVAVTWGRVRVRVRVRARVRVGVRVEVRVRVRSTWPSPRAAPRSQSTRSLAPARTWLGLGVRG